MRHSGPRRKAVLSPLPSNQAGRDRLLAVMRQIAAEAKKLSGVQTVHGIPHYFTELDWAGRNANTAIRILEEGASLSNEAFSNAATAIRSYAEVLKAINAETTADTKSIAMHNAALEKDIAAILSTGVKLDGALPEGSAVTLRPHSLFWELCDSEGKRLASLVDDGKFTADQFDVSLKKVCERFFIEKGSVPLIPARQVVQRIIMRTGKH